MLINKDYITDCYFQLIEEKLAKNNLGQIKANKLFRVKQYFPSWLRNIIFHPLNPAYSMFLQHKVHKERNGITMIPSLNPYAVDFFKYSQSHDINFETDDYYPKDDLSVVTSYIESRLKSIVPGTYEFNVPEKYTDMLTAINKLKDSIQEKGDGFYYTSGDINYYLPENLYNEAVFIHDYGLKYLDPSILEYISNKDFLDIGAFIGDSSILFEKKYNAKNVYAYEPVTHSQMLLEKTLKGNASCATHIVKKGIGEVHEFLDIFIDLDLLSSSSLNKELIDERSMKETIEITTIDDECKNKNVGLIKMDIEGSELSAIKGGKETISRDKPVMLVSMYHTGRDFFEIPPLLKSYVPSYQFRFLDIGITSPLFEKILVAYPQM